MNRSRAIVGVVRAVERRSAGSGLAAAAAAEGTRPELRVSLGEGRTARLDMADPRATVWADVLDDLRRQEQPAYVEVDPDTGTMTELLLPRAFRVGEIREAPDGLEVELVISHARHLLRPDTEGFEELLAALRQAQEEDQPVLVTETIDDHAIIDVRPVPGAVDGGT